MANYPNPYSSLLRQELQARNTAYASGRKLPHALSYGEPPVVVYEPFSEGRRHGNFLDASYRAILARPEWKRRLDKVHTHAARSLPRAERVWRELDSSMSSDALLMNVFCHPKTLKDHALQSLLGIEGAPTPEFGFRARVSLLNGQADRTEVDMKLGTLLVESKLTEADFQKAKDAIVERYRDLPDAFEHAAESHGLLHLLPTDPQRAGRACPRSQFLRNSGRPPSRSQGGLVHHPVVCEERSASNQVQGADLARTQ